MTSNTAQINPFNIVNFIGGMNLSPPSDTWFDDTSRAEVTVNLEGHHDNYVLSSNTTRMGFGSQWNDWSTNWTGTQVNPEPNTAVSKVKQNLDLNLIIQLRQLLRQLEIKLLI